MIECINLDSEKVSTSGDLGFAAGFELVWSYTGKFQTQRRGRLAWNGNRGNTRKTSEIDSWSLGNGTELAMVKHWVGWYP